MRHRTAFAELVHVVALALSLLLATCKPSPGPSPSASSSAAIKPAPTSVADAEALKKGGASWTNEEIRVYYNKLAAAIGPADEQWKRDGLSAEERAHRAYTMRHDARILTRAMMASPAEVDELRKRDQDKYGNPDGPTFDYLVDAARKKGLTGDAVYESIVASAQRTDAATNAAFGIKRAP